MNILSTGVPLGGIKGLPGSKLGDPSGDPGGLLQTLFSNVLGFLTVGAILWFLVQIIMGGYNWISAGGDPKSVSAARSRVMNAVIGLVVVFVSLIFVSVLGYLLGIEEVLNIGDFVNKLSI